MVTFNSNLGIFPLPGIVVDFTSGDLNGDGFNDIVTLNSNNIVSVALNNGNGTFRTAGQFLVGSSPTGVIIGNFNNSDRFLDLAVANSGSNTVSILLGDGAGNFNTVANPAVGFSPNGIIRGLDRSSWQDFFVTANTGVVGSRDILSIGRPNGDGTFRVLNQSINSPVDLNLRNLMAVNIDSDRTSEMVVIGGNPQ